MSIITLKPIYSVTYMQNSIILPSEVSPAQLLAISVRIQDRQIWAQFPGVYIISTVHILPGAEIIQQTSRQVLGRAFVFIHLKGLSKRIVTKEMYTFVYQRTEGVIAFVDPYYW